MRRSQGVRKGIESEWVEGNEMESGIRREVHKTGRYRRKKTNDDRDGCENCPISHIVPTSNSSSRKEIESERIEGNAMISGKCSIRKEIKSIRIERNEMESANSIDNYETVCRSKQGNER